MRFGGVGGRGSFEKRSPRIPWSVSSAQRSSRRGVGRRAARARVLCRVQLYLLALCTFLSTSASCPWSLPSSFLEWLSARQKKRYFGDINAFTADVRLVFANCLAYNPPGDWARAWGESCGAAFEVRVVLVVIGRCIVAAANGAFRRAYLCGTTPLDGFGSGSIGGMFTWSMLTFATRRSVLMDVPGAVRLVCTPFDRSYWLQS